MDSEIFNQPLRWGIAGCGKISNDFAAALSSLSKAGHKVNLFGGLYCGEMLFCSVFFTLQIVAAAARDVKSSADFSQTFSIPKYYGSYEELVQDPDVGESACNICGNVSV
jgi:dihydrodiol dehydrogenase / D-xylose 1-dehydrogenase (NADP)